MLRWNQITIPREFTIQNTRTPTNIAEKNVQQPTEEPDGRVLIGFNSSWDKGSSRKFLENVKLLRSSYAMPFKSSNYHYLKDNQVKDSKIIYYTATIA